MKVIDLLNKIANGEEVPKKIKVNGIVFILDKDDKVYKREDGNAEEIYTDYMIDGFVDLTDKVEVIEEDKKIEKIGIINFCENPIEIILHKKIDEIIDYINGG